MSPTTTSSWHRAIRMDLPYRTTPAKYQRCGPPPTTELPWGVFSGNPFRIADDSSSAAGTRQAGDRSSNHNSYGIIWWIICRQEWSRLPRGIPNTLSGSLTTTDLPTKIPACLPTDLPTSALTHSGTLPCLRRGSSSRLDQIESDWQDTGVVSYGHLGVLCKVVLPRLLLTYRLHMAALSPVTDGSFARAVSIAYDDIMDVWHAANLTLEVGWGHPAPPPTPTDPPPPLVSPTPAPFSRQINRPYQVPPTNPPDSPTTAPPTTAPFTEMQLYEYIRWAEMQISGRGQAGHAQAGHAEYTIGLLLYQHHENPGFGRG